MTTLRLSGCVTFLLAGILTSCLKEEKCPFQSYNVLIAVEDTNYDNINEIQLPLSAATGDSPLATYVGSLDVVTRSVVTSGRLFHDSVVPGSKERMVRLDSEKIPADRYEITIAGNAAAENLLSGEEYELELHPAGAESGDIYLERDTVDLPLVADRIIYLHRTKGKLLLLYTNLPQTVSSIELRATGIYKNVDGNMTYSGITQVVKTHPLPDQTGNGRTEFLLSPTIPDGNGELQATLYDKDGNTVRSFSGIILSILRNHITQLDIRYIPQQDAWEIWTYVTGEWVQLHNLTIE